MGGYRVSACLEGTDCTDCGGVDAIVDYTKPPAPDSGIETCVNTCPYARDGVCDDPRGANYCKLGTDCQDCGPVGADNFTRADDDGWGDDDDDYWTFNDGNFLDQTKGLEANRHRVRPRTVDSAGPAAMFLIVLEGMCTQLERSSLLPHCTLVCVGTRDNRFLSCPPSTQKLPRLVILSCNHRNVCLLHLMLSELNQQNGEIDVFRFVVLFIYIG